VKAGRWLLVALAALPVISDASDLSDGGPRIENFLLRDTAGAAYELYHQTNARAVVLIFTTTGCPIVQKSIPKIKELRDAFGPKGVVIWLINSNVADDAASIRDEARDFKIDLPILLDHSQSVARQLGAKRTAEAVCLRGGAWTVAYRGAIDDQFGYGTEKKHASHEYLRNALKNLLVGKKISPARTDFKGCLIQFEPSTSSGTK
jgi:peroxiredoxin